MVMKSSQISFNKAPLFSVAIACYNVEQYLPAIFRSIEWQTIDSAEVEYIFVDDCSTDNTAKLIQKWAAKRPNVQVYIQAENEGPGAARNVALDNARGDWITSVDPDDILDRDYFSNVKRMLDQGQAYNPAIIATRVYILNDETGLFKDTHPLRYRFQKGDRYVTFEEDNYAIQMGATAFIRREVINATGLRYDSNIKPSFEDGNFLVRYLLNFDTPVIGLCASAIYYYRKRADQSSLVQSGWSQPEKYTTQIERGYLPLLRSAMKAYGKVPNWLQNIVLYDVFWYFIEDFNMRSKTAWIAEVPEIKARFFENLNEVFSYIDLDRVLSFNIQGIRWVIREAVASYFYNRDGSCPRLHRWGLHDGQRNYSLLTRSLEMSRLECYSNGVRVTPDFEIVARQFYGETFAYEISFKLPAENSSIWYDGRLLTPVSDKVEKPGAPVSKKFLIEGKPSVAQGRTDKMAAKMVRHEILRLTTGTAFYSDAAKVLARKVRKKFVAASTSDSGLKDAVESLASNPSFKEEYAGCWILLDRTSRAGDNAEHFYRYLAQNHPERNAVFLLEEASDDWNRLSAEGFKLLPYGSHEAMAAYLLSSLCLSSDAVEACMYPAPRRIFGKRDIPFIFLQHGISDKDISRWINYKGFAGFVCGANSEFEAIKGPHSPYVLRTDQLFDVGFPRFDRLHQLRERSTTTSSTNTNPHFVIMPTWRGYLADLGDSESVKAREGFLQSQFFAGWSSLLRSTEFRSFCERTNASVDLVLHPNLEKFLPLFDLPPFATVHPISQIDFQELLSSAAVFITDYSSTAFDAAFIDIPVIYYQFDSGEIFSGVHNYRRGWYDAKNQGVGEWAADVDELLDKLAVIKANDFENSGEIKSRIDSFFGYRDDKSCERLYNQLDDIF